MPMVRRVMIAALLALAVAPLAAQTVDGWKVRIDKSQSASDPDDTPDLKFVAAGKGFRATGGPAGTFWNPANSAAGNYTLKGTFTLMKPSGHVNYYGLIFGGSNLEAATQTYAYFLVAQNGTFIIRHRTGEMIKDVQGRTPHAAIKQPDASGSSVNNLEVRVAGDTITFVVNGQTVNHVLDVQFEGLQVTRG
jgi:hypothetical protein